MIRLYYIELFLFYRRFCFLLLLFICACSSSKKTDGGRQVIAKVGEIYLYKDDLTDLVPSGSSQADSIELVKQYVNNWVKQTLILIKAEKNLSESQKNVRKKLDDYRMSLLTYIYEQELVKQNIDTNVTPEEIDKYYAEHQKDFELKDNIVRVTYIKIKDNAPKLDKLRQWYKSDNDKDIAQLKSYCVQFAENYFIDNNSWLLFDDLLKEIPIKMYDKELFLQNNRFIELKDSSNIYMVNIKGFKIKNSISPLSFEKANIRNIIINKRKLQLIEKMQQEVFDEAKKNNEFEIIDK